MGRSVRQATVEEKREQLHSENPLELALGRRIGEVLKKGEKKNGNMRIWDKYEFESEFLEIMEEIFYEIRSILLPETNYTAAEICGEEWWDTLSLKERRCAFLCLIYLGEISGGMEFVRDGRGGRRYFRVT